MLTGDLRNKIDAIWNDFWSGGLSNPLQVIEQITYLIFIKRLDEMQEVEERKANMLSRPLERRIFPKAPTRRVSPTRACGGRGSRISPRPRCSAPSTSGFFRSCVRSTARAAPSPTSRIQPKSGTQRQGNQYLDLKGLHYITTRTNVSAGLRR